MERVNKCIKCGLIQIILYFLIFSGGCRKFTEVAPPDNVLASTLVFSNNNTATEALTGIYGQMQRMPGLFGNYPDLSLNAGLYADELKNFSTDPTQAQFFADDLSSTTPKLGALYWAPPYSMIYQANAVLEGLAVSSKVSSAVKQQLIGEAKFIRAFCYFYLLNLFGNIPLVLSTDYRVNNTAAQASRPLVYEQIISDLKEAQGLLNTQYIDGTDTTSTTERTRPNRYAATALLARVYLYAGDWADAEIAANEVIGSTGFYELLMDKNLVFVKNSREAIWQFPATGISNISTFDGLYFIPITTPNYIALSDSLLQAFEPGDTRRFDWVDSIVVGQHIYYYPFKYKKRTDSSYSEYTMILRLAEQYLIRAEALAQQGDLVDAAKDLNTLRKRANLDTISVGTKTGMLAAIYHEQRVELFTEWGHRLLDLKRTGLADQILRVTKKETWRAADTLWPIPLTEIQNNPNLVQNPGY